MVVFERPSWGSVVLVGLAFLLVIVLVVGVGSYVRERDVRDFCVNRSGLVVYPVCERGVFGFCGEGSNLSVLVDCDSS